MIYLASPYSHPDPAMRESRYRRAVMAVAYLLNKGQHVFSPIVHCHAVAIAYQLPTDFEFWRDYDHAFISLCERLIVFTDEGWTESRGVRAEIELADSLRLPVEFLTWEAVSILLPTESASYPSVR